MRPQRLHVTQAHRAAMAALLLPLGCSGSSGHVDSTKPAARAAVSTVMPTAPNSCDMAARLRAKVKPFLAEGRMHRVIRLIQKADKVCPASAPESYAALVTTLAELGRCAEARKVAAQIEADSKASIDAKDAARMAKEKCDKLDRVFPDNDDAKQDMRRLVDEAQAAEQKSDPESQRSAKEKYVAAWEAWRPNPRALVGAGFAAKKLGQSAESQRFFDRAIVDAEKVHNTEVKLDVRNGFAGVIHDAAWSKDGRWFGVAYQSGVSIFDRGHREIMKLLARYDDVIVSLAFSSDGRTVVSGTHSGLVQSWDIETGMIRHRFGVRTRPITRLAFSPGDKILISSGFEDFVTAWDVASGVEIARLPSIVSYRRPIAYSPRGSVVAIGNTYSFALWDPVNDKVVREFKNHTMHVNALGFSSDGRTIASASDDSVSLWDVATGKELRRFAQPADSATTLSFAAGDTLLVSDSKHTDVWVWKVATGKPVKLPPEFSTGVALVAISPEGKTAATMRHWSKSVRMWDFRTQKEVEAFLVHSAAIETLAHSPDGLTIALGLDDGTLRVWDEATGDHLRVFQGHTDKVHDIAYSPDGKTLASISLDNTVRLWDVGSTRQQQKLEQEWPHLHSVDYSPDGRALAIGYRDVDVVDLATGSIRFHQEGKPDGFARVTYSPQGQLLTAGLLDDGLQLWDVDAGKELRRFKTATPMASALAYGPDGKTLALAAGDNTVTLWDAATGNLIRKFQGAAESGLYLAYSADGRSLAISALGGTIRLWNLLDGEIISQLGERTDLATQLSLSRNGRMIVTAYDDTAQVHDLRNGQLLTNLRFTVGMNAAYAFTPAGHIEFLGPDGCAARQYATCRIGRLVFPFEVCAERFHAPGLLADVYASDTSYLEPENVPASMNCP